MNWNSVRINPLNAKVSPICHLLALYGAHHILHVSRVRVKRREVGKDKKGIKEKKKIFNGLHISSDGDDYCYYHHHNHHIYAGYIYIYS